MKTLYLIRHAKSSWKEPYSSDYERALNQRGLRDAPRMASYLKGEVGGIDCIISSSATRTKLTAGYFKEKLNPTDIIYDKQIYEASYHTLHSLVENIDNKYSTCILIGHNPGLNLLADYYLNDYIGHLPTCGIVGIDFEIENWRMVSKGLGLLRMFKVPKEL